MQSMLPLQALNSDDNINDIDSDENDFTICGFKSPQKIQWINGRGKSLKLSRILDIMNTDPEPRVLEIAVSWNESYQRTTILNIIKDIHHQYCTFNTEYHEPINTYLSSDDNDEDDIYSNSTINTNNTNNTNNNTNNEEEKKQEAQLNIHSTQPFKLSIENNDSMQLLSLPQVKPNRSAPSPTYKQCLKIYDHIPIINDHIPKKNRNLNNNNDDIKIQNIGNIPTEIDICKKKTLTRIGQCLALEELFSILCWKTVLNFAIKIQFADIITIENSTSLIIKYRKYFKLDSLSCIWYHGIFLHEFPMSGNNRSFKNVFNTTGGGGSSTNNLSFHDFTENIKKIPSITYSLSWPTSNMTAVKSPASLKLCLSSILSEVSIGKEHDIIIHFPIQYIYDCYYIINDLITNKSYFPYVAFNFYNQYNNLHNFDFTIYYKLKYDKMQINNGKTTNNNGKINGYHIKPPNLQKQSSSSWNIFARNKPKKIERKLPYETNVTDVRNLKQDQIVCKADLNWLSAHIHQLFTFTSVSCVRFKESPNDEFRKILGQHNVAEWSGRLSWNPKPKSMRNMNMNNGNNYNNNNNNSPRDEIKYNFKQPKQPGIDWNLWQLARIDSRSRHFQSCLYNNNIGLAQRNGGWLISTRELQPPYRIKGRFFTADKHGILSIYIRCSSIEYPTNNELPLFSIGIHIGNEKLKIVTNRLQNKQITQQCGIGACIDNGYDFQIIDRGVMYPIVCQVERTGKDGKGDNFPRGKNIQIPYPRDSSQWMYHVIFVNSSNEWIIIDRLVVDEKQN